MARIFATLVLGALAADDDLHLDPTNFDEMTAGKSVFLKMYAPWCGHCKKMAPDWVKLQGEINVGKDALVASVDCTAAGKPICDAHGVKGFPTLKYGDPAALEDYQGGRTYGDLKKFAEENLKPSCSPANIDLCDDEKKAKIEELQAMDKADLDAKIKSSEGELADAEKAFKELVEGLQKQYEAANKEKDSKLKDIKDAGLGLMKSVRAFSAKADKDEL